MSHVNHSNKSRNPSSSRFIFRKREPPKPRFSKADVFVSNNSNFKSNLERIEKLWIQGEPVITVRALGAAVPRTINLCLQFQLNHYHALDLETTTSTVNLTDDFEPLDDDNDFETLNRPVSSICIKLVRKINS